MGVEGLQGARALVYNALSAPRPLMANSAGVRFDALLSLGIALAYVFAGPVLEWLGPKGVYGVGGLSAALAAVLLLPILRLRHDAPAVPVVDGVIAPPDIA